MLLAISMYIIIYVTLCVGRSKAFVGQYILYCPVHATWTISIDIAQEQWTILVAIVLLININMVLDPLTLVKVNNYY